MAKRVRSAADGRFKTKKYGDANPNKVVNETVKKKKGK
jgi:hypothetical protein